MSKLLMCRPNFYTVDYEINPWMHTREKPDGKLATTQWEALYKTLTSIGITVDLIEPVKGLPDMVFTANGGIISGNKFILSNFRHDERQGEAAYFEAWARANGYEVVRLPEETIFEGEGDMLRVASSSDDYETLVAGYRFRSDIGSHTLVSEMLGTKVVSIELASEFFYHLDTCFCPISKSSAIYYPGAFDSYGEKALGALIENLIELTEEDAKHFCANAVVNGTDIVMNNCSEKLREELSALGFTLHTLDLSEFIKAGGSAKCQKIQEIVSPPGL
jgi:N-dimethylarginine dimethylaminohydrolase